MFVQLAHACLNTVLKTHVSLVVFVFWVYYIAKGKSIFWVGFVFWLSFSMDEDYVLGNEYVLSRMCIVGEVEVFCDMGVYSWGGIHGV